MANLKISQLPVASTPLAGTELVPIVQGGVTDQTTVADILGAGTSPGSFTTLTTTGNSALGNAEATDTHAIKGATTVLANSASAALTVTQTGAGNAFVVEDSASTDTTPFAINGSGQVLIGVTTAQAALAGQTPVLQAHSAAGSTDNSALFANWDVTTGQAPTISFAKSVSDTIGTRGAVANTQLLGSLHFLGDDGTAFIRAAQITAEVDGTPGTNDMPGRLLLSTTADGASAPTERLRIDSAGNVGIGVTASAFAKLHVGGTAPSSGALSLVNFTNVTVPSASTTAQIYRTTIATEAAAFTLGSLDHFYAAQGTIGATSAVTVQHGFLADSTLTGATNNYGFYSNIASAANRYNFYAPGSANNAYAGNSSFGQVAAPIAAVDTTSLATNIVTNAAGTYTVLTTDTTIIQTTAGSTYTLPAAASFTGRILNLVTQFAGAVISDASNVVPIAGGAAGTAILAATAGKCATLQSNGTNWIIISAN